jgi:hypothetical protein|tara:strand:- start:2172 stop:2543 length:372 start_codon:yes stop_codon:yes gene_type:complete
MLTKEIQENFPFLSVVTYGGNEYIGVIINQDATVTSMYVYTELRTKNEQAAFLELGEAWWWESNRLIPINIFLKNEMDPYKYCIITMNSKDVRVMIGPCVNISNMTVKRIKRKSVQLIRKPPK